MEKLKCILFGGLLLMALPQAFAVGDKQDFKQVGSTGDTAENFSDYYAANVPFLSPW